MSGKSLAEQQAELVAALVAGGPVPAGVDPARLAAARDALLRKRSGEVAVAWPQLAAAFGSRWQAEFAGWAAGRPPAGAHADGLAFAGWLDAEGRLPEAAREEYRRAAREEFRRAGRVEPADHPGRGRGSAVIAVLGRFRPLRWGRTLRRR